MTYCLCQPRNAAACVAQNWRPQAHSYMMSLPRRYLTADRYLVAALQANGLVGRMGARVVPTALGIRLFLQQFRFCTPVFGFVRARAFMTRTTARCDARPACWRPDPGSVAFRNPCKI